MRKIFAILCGSWGNLARCGASFALLWAALVLPGVASAADSANSFAAESPISAGPEATCAVTAGGAISCWGQSPALIGEAPGGGGFLSVSAGAGHACAIRSDGTLACWGANAAGESRPPSGEFLAVAAGPGYSCAIAAEGSLACWGEDASGQTRPPSGRFVSVSAGTGHACAIRSDGTLACWGDDAAGESQPPSGEFLAVAAGPGYSCAIAVEGSLACWGEDASGQTRPPSGRFRSLAAGTGQACAIGVDGRLACWGAGAGQAQAPAGRFRWIASGGAHGCAVGADGRTLCWGEEGSGMDAAAAPAIELGHLPLTTGVDSNYNCAIRADGLPQCWGADSTGEPLAPAPGAEAMAISGEADRACMLTASGEAVCWGAGSSVPPQPGPFRAIASTAADSCAIGAQGGLACWGEAGPLLTPPTGAFRSLSGGDEYACAVRAEGTLACWGEAGLPTLREIPEGRFRAVTAGTDRACGLRVDGTLACWGSNGFGYLSGFPSGTIRAVAAGAYHECAVRSGGEMTCWENGEAVGAIEGAFYSLSAGANHTCAERDDGIVTCLGHNDFGQSRPHAAEAALPRGVLGTPYSSRIEATPETPAPAFSLASGQLPPGLELGPGGELSGTPTESGDYSFGVAIDDRVSDTEIAQMTLDVVGGPSLQVDPAQVTSSDSALLSGTVTPQNLPAEAWFEYWPAAGSENDAARTPARGFEPASGSQADTESVTGLSPETEYRYRLSGESEAGPDVAHSQTGSFSTGLPPPVSGQSFNVETVAGSVTTKCEADQGFSGLVRAEHLPIGCLVDTANGTVRVTFDKGAGETQTAFFWGGVFRVGQNAGVGQTAVMKLVGRLYCERRTSRGRRRLRRHGGGRRLWGSGEGSYKTVGGHGAATVRGTIWLVRDRCDGSTLVKVKRGTVWVDDFVKETRVVLKAPGQYVIEPPTARLGG